jgi:hypothetical protein
MAIAKNESILGQTLSTIYFRPLSVTLKNHEWRSFCSLLVPFYKILADKRFGSSWRERRLNFFFWLLNIPFIYDEAWADFVFYLLFNVWKYFVRSKLIRTWRMPCAARVDFARARTSAVTSIASSTSAGLAGSISTLWICSATTSRSCATAGRRREWPTSPLTTITTWTEAPVLSLPSSRVTSTKTRRAFLRRNSWIVPHFLSFLKRLFHFSNVI